MYSQLIQGCSVELSGARLREEQREAGPGSQRGAQGLAVLPY